LKVTNANIYLVKVGALQPVVLELITDEGVAGLGEAAVAYGIGAASAAAMTKELAQAMVLGRDPFRIEEIWSEMYDHSFWAKGGGPIVFAAVSAIEQALWDIKGKALGVPVYELLGGKVRDDVLLYANGWSYDCKIPDDFARAAERPLRDGFKALKCYPLAVPNGRGGIRHVSRRAIDKSFAACSIEKVRSLRRAVGAEIDLMVDLSGGLTTDETIRFCRQLEDLDILFVEEPADPFDLPALQKIAENIDIPIATGERVYTRYGFRPIMESRSVDILQPDPGNTGGIAETRKISAMAEAYSMRIQLHVCAGPVATAVALQIEACMTNFLIHEVYPYRFAEHFQLVDGAPELEIRDGRMRISDRAGLGVNLVHHRMLPYRWAETAL
jgi:galactonate dehydratase